MNSRSKKYYENRNADKGDKKGSTSEAGYNEENEKTLKGDKENPGPSKTQDKPGSDNNRANQDDTGGGNDSGKRTDDN